MIFIVCRIPQAQFFRVCVTWISYKVYALFFWKKEKNLQLINIGCDDVYSKFHKGTEQKEEDIKSVENKFDIFGLR